MPRAFRTVSQALDIIRGKNKINGNGKYEKKYSTGREIFYKSEKEKCITIWGNAYNIFNKVLKFNIYDNGSKHQGGS